MKNKRILIILFLITTILLLPLIAMRFTNEVNWDITDFIVAAVLLFGFGGIFEFLARKEKHILYQVMIGIIVILILFLVWAELAVGIFGSPWAGS